MKGYNTFVVAVLGVLATHSAIVQSAAPPPDPPEEPNWNNMNPGDPVNVNCDCGYALHKVRSQYSGDPPDRQWLWECIKVSLIYIFSGHTHHCNTNMYISMINRSLIMTV